MHTTAMPTTQRSFLSSFLSAFRAHPSALSKAPASISPSPASPPSAAIWTAAAATAASHATKAHSTPVVSEHAVTSPRPINSKSNPYGASTSTAAADKQLQPSLPALQHNVTPQTHMARSPSTPSSPVYGPPTRSSFPTCQEVQRSRTRRGSDSSMDSGGFRESRASSTEKYFVGGRMANGEERYYKLSMIKRERSADRISADQLSL